tara:strand:+ start:618 stop:1217 length:600 start_codon:yes stop_codon:yes gene_type:complete
MNIIVAACKNKGIGVGNRLPWRLKNELNYFKNVTVGKGNNAVVMGKNTWMGLNKSLPKRDNYVISRTLAIDFHFKRIHPQKYRNINVLTHSERFYDLVKKDKYDEIFVIGGEKLYKGVINNKLLNTIYYTNIHNDFKCDTFFPEIPPYFEKIYESETFSEKDVNYNFEIYCNINNVVNFDFVEYEKNIYDEPDAIFSGF